MLQVYSKRLISGDYPVPNGVRSEGHVRLTFCQPVKGRAAVAHRINVFNGGLLFVVHKDDVFDVLQLLIRVLYQLGRVRDETGSQHNVIENALHHLDVLTNLALGRYLHAIVQLLDLNHTRSQPHVNVQRGALGL